MIRNVQSILRRAFRAHAHVTTNANFEDVSGVSRTKIEEVTLDALRTRQSLVKGERLVRHEMRAVLIPLIGVQYPG